MAESTTAAFTAMGSAGGPSPDTQGLKAYQAMGTARRRVRTIVFHGSSDFTVYPLNGHQVARQCPAGIRDAHGTPHPEGVRTALHPRLQPGAQRARVGVVAVVEQARALRGGLPR